MTDIRSISEFLTTSTPKTKTTSKTTHNSTVLERKTLQTIQPSVEINRKLKDGNHQDCGDFKPKKAVSSDSQNHSSQTTKNISISIYEDPVTALDSHGVLCTRSIQTDSTLLDALLEERQLKQMNESTDSGHLSGFISSEAYDLMSNENIPEHYWKDLAEERRIALAKTLDENKELCDKIEHLTKENGRLSDLASKAEQLEHLLSTVLADDSDDDEERLKSEEDKDVSEQKEDSGNEDSLLENPKANTPDASE